MQASRSLKTTPIHLLVSFFIRRNYSVTPELEGENIFLPKGPKVPNDLYLLVGASDSPEADVCLEMIHVTEPPARNSSWFRRMFGR